MIAHVDADAFFASVLQRKYPKLRGKPLLALGMGGGCVIAASYEAKAYGVKTGMRLSEARRLVPNPITIPSDFQEACVASEQLQSILRNDCAAVERYSVDEWFIDLNSRPGGLPHNLRNWAQVMQDRMKRETGLTVSIGVASSKLLAKMASEYRKPAGITVLYGNDIPAFLQDRTAEAIPGVGRRRAVHTAAKRWLTAWDIAQADSDAVRQIFGRPGLDMQRELHGEAVERVNTEAAPPKSVSRCRSFHPCRDEEALFAQVLAHLTRVLLKMRLQDLACQRVAVWLRSEDYSHHSGTDQKLPQPMATEEELLPYIRKCFLQAYSQGNAYTQVGLALHDLRPQTLPQYSLFESPQQLDSCEKMQQALDDVHQRYGRDAVIRGSAIPLQRKNKSIATPTMYGEVLNCF